MIARRGPMLLLLLALPLIVLVGCFKSKPGDEGDEGAPQAGPAGDKGPGGKDGPGKQGPGAKGPGKAGAAGKPGGPAEKPAPGAKGKAAEGAGGDEQTAEDATIVPARALPVVTSIWVDKVVEVPEGDTIVVLRDRVPQTLRLLGVDCPDKRQTYGPRARLFISQFVLGKQVRVRKVEGIDADSPLAEVTTLDGVSLSEALLQRGLAWVDPEQAADDVLLAALEKQAREDKRGLWRDPSAKKPWEFRTGSVDAAGAAKGAKGGAKGAGPGGGGGPQGGPPGGGDAPTAGPPGGGPPAAGPPGGGPPAGGPPAPLPQ